jgi:hypothetical protein
MTDDLEERFWGGAINTYNEETKQLLYLKLMGFEPTPTWQTRWSFDAGGKSIIDIGGGPCSVLLKFVNLGPFATVVDPGPWPQWAIDRYLAADIGFARECGEDLDKILMPQADLALIYNVLQHCIDPALVIAKARACAKGLRMFEWIDLSAHEGHPHELKADLLNEWAGREGRIIELKGENECYGRAWVLGPPPGRSRITLEGAP